MHACMHAGMHTPTAAATAAVLHACWHGVQGPAHPQHTPRQLQRHCRTPGVCHPFSPSVITPCTDGATPLDPEPLSYRHTLLPPVLHHMCTNMLPSLHASNYPLPNAAPLSIACTCPKPFHSPSHTHHPPPPPATHKHTWFEIPTGWSGSSSSSLTCFTLSVYTPCRSRCGAATCTSLRTWASQTQRHTQRSSRPACWRHARPRRRPLLRPGQPPSARARQTRLGERCARRGRRGMQADFRTCGCSVGSCMIDCSVMCKAQQPRPLTVIEPRPTFWHRAGVRCVAGQHCLVVLRCVSACGAAPCAPRPLAATMESTAKHTAKSHGCFRWARVCGPACFPESNPVCFAATLTLNHTCS